MELTLTALPYHSSIERFGTINVGDILVFRDMDDLRQNFGYRLSNITCGWSKNMEELCGEEFTVTESMMRRIRNRERGVHYANGYTISLDMLRHKTGTTIMDEVVEEAGTVLKELNIINTSLSEDIKNKMIALVDKKRLKTLLSIAASRGENKYFVNDNTLDIYLKSWVEAKYPYFVLFGEKLSIQKDIECEMNYEDMKVLIKELSYKYPKYSIPLNRLRADNFIENKIFHNDVEFSNFAPYYQVGMKVSKFLSQYFNDKEFDTDLSKIMQQKTTQGTICVSIDPYDYLTSSINSYGWRSCFDITDGDYATGAVAYMLDSSTLIAYACRDKIYDYNKLGFKFKGNSKYWRQYIHMDTKTSAIIFSRQYPATNHFIDKEIRYLLEEQISNYLNVENKWGRYRNSTDANIDNVGYLHYSDILNGNSYDYVKHKFLSNKVKPIIKIGVKSLSCTRCGREFNSSKKHINCAYCV